MDIAGPPNVLISLVEAVQVGTSWFSLEPDGTIAFHASHGFLVHIDLIQMGDGSDVIRAINATNPVHGASVASKSDLLWLRAATVVERGKISDLDDFLWLLYEIVKDGDLVPALGKQELDLVVETGAHLGILDRLLLAAVIGDNNDKGGFQILGIEHCLEKA